jgi:prolyl oligopeptidase
MFVVSPDETPAAPRPTVLYGYGGFGIPMSPGYSAAILAWVAAGGVWAIANLRGGGEEGEEWHRDGMLGKKQNVFDDFHAAAEFLIDEGWTTPAQLGIYGGSNGGLLVGAAITQRPDLFNAVVCVAPLLDMIRYTTSELGPTWTVEYGDPEVAEEFGWLIDYSPYHRVVEGTDYPATMIAVFDNDTRTDPMHGRKMCAALQHATSGTRPILIRAEGDVGHGARSMSKSVEESADTLAFFAHWTGLGRA